MNSPLALKDAFAAISAIPLDVLKKVVGEMLTEFLPLQEKLSSEDPQVREEALKKAEELKSRMKDLLTKTYQDAGVDIASVAASLKNHLNKK